MTTPGALTVLDAAEPAQQRAWLELWQRWPEREPFAHPAYVALFARDRDRACCAAMQGAEGAVLFPFVLRPLAAEPWAGADNPYWDLTSPYGYGGPFAWACNDEECEAFWAQLEHWAHQQHLVSSFVRMGLFAEQCIAFPGEIEARGFNVVRALDLAPEALWRDYAHKVRKNVKRARAEGLTVSEDPRGEHLDAFCAIYRETMQRREARRGYYFSPEFFAAFPRELAGSATFFHVWRAGEIVSTELVLISARFVYSFLGGTAAEAFAWRPNDLLKHEVALWARARGKQGYVLGGGYQGRDGIFRYKLAFAPGGELPFRVGMAIHDRAACETLVETRAAWEQGQSKDWQAGEGFFPTYRG